MKPSAQSRTLPLWTHNPNVSPLAWHLDGGDLVDAGYIERHGDGYLAKVHGKQLGVYRTMAAAANAVEKALGAK